MIIYKKANIFKRISVHSFAIHQDEMRILLACERSAGHIFPALGLAAKVDRSDTVSFFATSPFLREYIEKEGFVCVGRSFRFRNLFIEGLWRLFESLYLILKIRPRKIVGFGGRDSFFLVLFGSLFGIKTAIYEPNLKPGRANRLLAPFVGEVLCGFNAGIGTNRKSRVIGIPLRKNIRRIDKAEARRILNFNDDPVVFCLGGSQGSSFVNDIFVEFVRSFRGNLQVIHLTGRDNYLKISSIYNTIKVRSFIKSFYYAVEVLYSAADLVVSRAGASALAEIVFYQLPALLLPHPKAGGHQKENALYLQDKGAAVVCLQNGLSPKDFNVALSRLIRDNQLRWNIKENLSKISLGVSYEDFNGSSYI